MKKLLPWIFLVGSTTALADWVKIDSPISSLYEKFIDLNAIRQTGPMNTMRRVWELNNLAKASANNIASVKQQVEYDCKDRRYRVIEESSFSERWAQGESLAAAASSTKAGDWNAIDPGGISQTVFNRVCPNG